MCSNRSLKVLIALLPFSAYRKFESRRRTRLCDLSSDPHSSPLQCLHRSAAGRRCGHWRSPAGHVFGRAATRCVALLAHWSRARLQDDSGSPTSAGLRLFVSVGSLGVGASRAAEGRNDREAGRWRGLRCRYRCRCAYRTRTRRCTRAASGRGARASRGPPVPTAEPAVGGGAAAGVPAGGARLLAVSRGAQLFGTAATAIATAELNRRVSRLSRGLFTRTGRTVDRIGSKPGARDRTSRALGAVVRVGLSDRRFSRRRAGPQARQNVPLVSTRRLATSAFGNQRDTCSRCTVILLAYSFF